MPENMEEGRKKHHIGRWIAFFTSAAFAWKNTSAWRHREEVHI